jgi:hypothetical protein
MAKKREQNPLEGRRLSDVISEMAYGEVDRQAGGALRRVVEACLQTGKKGKISFSIEVTPEDNMVSLASKLAATIPHPSAPSTTFFVDGQGDLTQDDPRQLTLRRVEDPAPGRPRVVDFQRANNGRPAAPDTDDGDNDDGDTH